MGSKQFLFCPQCFLLIQIILSPFGHIFDIISLFAAEFKEPKIGVSGTKLRFDRQAERQLARQTDNGKTICPSSIDMGQNKETKQNK